MAKYLTAAKLSKRGMTVQEIANEMCITTSRAAGFLDYARKVGALHEGEKPERQFKVVADLTRQGLSVKEIAVRMGKTIVQVDSLRRYARAAGELDRAQHKPKLYEQVAVLFKDGHRAAQVAAELGVPKRSVYRAKRMARDLGLLSDFTPLKKRGTLNIGSLQRELDKTSNEIILAMRRDTLDGSTIAEMLVEMYMDKYFEDQANANIAAE